MTEPVHTEISVDIANLDFIVGAVREVGLAKIYIKFPYGEKPDAYSVSWNEWIKDFLGENIHAKKEPQTYRIKKIQKFEDYETARLFFIEKIDSISQLYKEIGE